jgi:hypothetical protein
MMKKLLSIKSFILFVSLGCASLHIYAQASAKDFVVIKPEQVVWGDAPAGVKTAVLFGDPNKPGMYVVRNIFPEGVMSAPHFHTQDRFVTVIKGTWWAGTDASWDPATTVGLPA